MHLKIKKCYTLGAVCDRTSFDWTLINFKLKENYLIARSSTWNKPPDYYGDYRKILSQFTTPISYHEIAFPINLLSVKVIISHHQL